ncbi:DUF2254 domain-containing protein [Roseovarius sp. CAU 1744]|uniref:DUF2254 domain-containing protein n=1 Tax=Roseovarius sp. CAU 1744 TaxID=3140368 RepID=UPI00325B7D56
MNFKTSLKLIRRITRQLWVSVTLFAVLAVLTMALSVRLDDFIPVGLSARFTPDSVVPILTILASSMLAVSTFSLNVMVTAHNAAASQATPRVRRILLQDTTTQRVLAAFIGTFVYSLSTIILFKSGLHGPGTPFVVLVTIVAITLIVVIAILRWIDHLSDLGSLDTSLRVTEAEVRPCILSARRSPALGGSPLSKETIMPTDARPITAARSGYVQFIDMAALGEGMAQENGQLYFSILPGDFVLEGQAIAHGVGVTDDEIDALRGHVVIGDLRTFEQDAGFGMLVFSEIASRALSPGINDPGTAIDVIARQQKLLWEWAHEARNDDAPPYPNIFMKPFSAEILVQGAFASIARDGAATIEVSSRLLTALQRLSVSPDKEMAQAAKEMAARVSEHAEIGLVTESDKKRVRELA